MNEIPVSYIRSRDAWYAHVIPENDATVFMVGAYHPDGSCDWEFAICQERVEGKPMRVKMFSDSWDAFLDAPRFFVGLAELGEDANPDNVLDLMKASGFHDCTEEVKR